MFEAIQNNVNNQISDLQQTIKFLTKQETLSTIFSWNSLAEIAKDLAQDELYKIIDTAVNDIKNNLGDDTYKTISAIETVFDIKTYNNLESELINMISLVKNLMSHQLDVVCFFFYMSVSESDFMNVAEAADLKSEGELMWKNTDEKFKNLIKKLKMFETTEKDLKTYYEKYKKEYRIFLEVAADKLAKDKRKASVNDFADFYNQIKSSSIALSPEFFTLQDAERMLLIKNSLEEDADNFIRVLRDFVSNGSMMQNIDEFISNKVFNFLLYAQEITSKAEFLDTKISVNKTVLFSNVFALGSIMQKMKTFMGDNLEDLNLSSLINIDEVGYREILNQFNLTGDATTINTTVDEINSLIQDLKFDFKNFKSPYDNILKQSISYPFKSVLEQIGKLYSTEWCNDRVKEYKDSYEQYSKDIHEFLVNAFTFGVDEDMLKVYFTTSISPIAAKCLLDLTVLRGILLSLEKSKELVGFLKSSLGAAIPNVTDFVDTFVYGNGLTQWLYGIIPTEPMTENKNFKTRDTITEVVDKVNQLRAFVKTISNFVKIGEKVIGAKGG